MLYWPTLADISETLSSTVSFEKPELENRYKEGKATLIKTISASSSPSGTNLYQLFSVRRVEQETFPSKKAKRDKKVFSLTKRIPIDFA